MQGKEPLESWQKRWSSGQTGWDQGRSHPELPFVLEQAQLVGKLLPGSQIFSAGCGRAHHEAFLASQGYQVKAIDAVSLAIEEAKSLYGHLPGLKLEVADVFDVQTQEKAAYDAIFDRAMLCAIQPTLRAEYLASCLRRLKPGGLWMGILFREVIRPEGPPFAIDEAEAMELFGKDFHLCLASQADEILQIGAVKSEWICIWRKAEERRERDVE